MLGQQFFKHAIQREIQGKQNTPITENNISISDLMIILNNVHFHFMFGFGFAYPQKKRFCLQIKPGGLIRVHTSVLQPTSLYKSLFISEETSSDELLTLLLSCYNLNEPVEQFSLYEVCNIPLNMYSNYVCIPRDGTFGCVNDKCCVFV